MSLQTCGLTEVEDEIILHESLYLNPSVVFTAAFSLLHGCAQMRLVSKASLLMWGNCICCFAFVS